MTNDVRYEPRIENEMVHLEGEGHSLKIGSMSDIVELVGGEQYTIEYTDRQSAAAWLTTDDANQLSFNVREVIAEMTHTHEFVTILENAPIDEIEENGYPKRTSLFVDLLTDIWDEKGSLER